MDAEGLEEDAINAIDCLEHDAKAWAGLKIQITLRPHIPQLQEEEAQLMETVNTLKSRNRIFDPPTLEDLMDPPEEKEIRQGLMTELNRSDEVIVAKVQHEMAVAKGKVIEVESDNDNDETPEPLISCVETMLMCLMFEHAVKEHGDIEDMLELPHILYCFHAKLQRKEFFEAKQTTLDRYMK
ncbi:hypothetical protein JVU11DRAFT_11665 [Chiua virens]|nr:hypothetical protein JVU11DRAFT_11665 [Chiua virens]